MASSDYIVGSAADNRPRGADAMDCLFGADGNAPHAKGRQKPLSKNVQQAASRSEIEHSIPQRSR